METPHTDPSRAERFLESFKRIEEHFRAVLKRDGSYKFSRLVIDMRTRDLITDEQALQLANFGFLRNALSHSSLGTGEVIADPRQSAVEQLEKLEQFVTRPRLVVDVLPQRIEQLHQEDPVSAFFLLVKTKDFSQAPLIHNRKYVGMVTLAAVARWVAGSRHFDAFDLTHTPLGTVIDGTQEQEDQFLECPPTMTVPEALNLFDLGASPPARGLILVGRGEIDTVHALVTYEDLPTLLANAR